MKSLGVILITLLTAITVYGQEGPRYRSGKEYGLPRVVLDTTLTSDTVIVYIHPNTKVYPEDFGKVHPSYIFNELAKQNFEASGIDPLWLAMAGSNMSKVQIPRFRKRFIIGTSIGLAGIAGIIKGYSLADPTYVYYNGTQVLNGDDQKKEANIWKIVGAAFTITGVIIDIDAFKFLKRAEINGGPDSFSITYPLFNTRAPYTHTHKSKKR